ncbi:tRNA (adenine-N1)-methyltransferase [Agrococcus jejuensis]|uniref:tRNA (adenine-N1)-methyltransferase n=1 Tax=Agrococcus jejuensis TaxID=399736 RepID=UPI0011A7788D|nr:tRNA (adenine-N1)-methyltransferase [Agrococcus jejuensis]
MTPRTGPLRLGDPVQLTGPKQRLHTIVLTEGSTFHTQHGALPHEEIVGHPDGSIVHVGEHAYLAVRPLLHDYVMSMPRGAAIVYPKDAGHILTYADIQPGLTVVEAGVGSGALSLWLLRALAGQGELVSFERRQEFLDIAEANVAGWFGERPANWRTAVGDLAETLGDHVPDQTADRVVLDMLAPWECVDAAATALQPGGILLAYVATVTQLSRTVEAVRDDGRFAEPQSQETLIRSWHVDGLAVRPDHRMVAHTGFLMTARRVADDLEIPSFKRRSNKASYTDADVEAWTPGAVGDREKSDKRLRRAVRDAQRQADRLAAGTIDSDSRPEDDA